VCLPGGYLSKVACEFCVSAGCRSPAGWFSEVWGVFVPVVRSCRPDAVLVGAVLEQY
jgi:hypothetical protein